MLLRPLPKSNRQRKREYRDYYYRTVLNRRPPPARRYRTRRGWSRGNKAQQRPPRRLTEHQHYLAAMRRVIKETPNISEPLEKQVRVVLRG